MILGYEEEKWKKLGGEFTAREIMQQPEVWLKTYELVKALEPQIKAFHTQYIQEGSRIIFAGAGSSDYIGTIISHTIGKKLKAQVMAVATTDIVLTEIKKQFWFPLPVLAIVQRASEPSGCFKSI